MAISNKTRKILWGRSGSRCAICKEVIIIDATDNDAESVVAEECHIVSAKEHGPRYDSNFPSSLLDEHENLILLCRTHHKMVDDQVETFTVDILGQLKSNHESWVSERLGESKEKKPFRIRRKKENIPEQLTPILTGKELFNLVANASGYMFDHEDLDTEEEVGLVSDFLQSLQDWGEVAADLESGERVRACHTLNQELEKIRVNKFGVFAAEETRYLEGGIQSEPIPLQTAILKVVRQNSPDIKDPFFQQQ